MPHRRSLLAFTAALLIAPLFLTAQGRADKAGSTFDVTITNITNFQIFTPLLVASHRRGIKIFTPGEPASEALATLAESGNPGPLKDSLEAMDGVDSVAVAGGVMPPGQSVTIAVERKGGNRGITVAGMLIPTNDAFVALVDAKAPNGRGVRTYRVPAYDAGTEANDESCAHIPGPPFICEGEGVSAPADGDEGFVDIHRGIHGSPSLDASAHDWRNPVAIIRITRGSDED